MCSPRCSSIKPAADMVASGFAIPFPAMSKAAPWTDKVADMGGEGGRPEKTAMVSACGIFKS